MASTQDLQALIDGKPAAIAAMMAVADKCQAACAVARRVGLQETFGNEAALQAQVAAALPDVARLNDLYAELLAKVGEMDAALAVLAVPLANVAAEYVPPEPEEPEV